MILEVAPMMVGGGVRAIVENQKSVAMLCSDDEPAAICKSTALLKGTIIRDRKALRSLSN